MSMQDPVSDMLTRIRNAGKANHQHVAMNHSNLKEQIANVLKTEGYIVDFHIEDLGNNKKSILIDLKYYRGAPVIERIQRVSKPGLRIYKSNKQLGKVAGFGVAVLTTSQGVMSHVEAIKRGIGGEVLCEVA